MNDTPKLEGRERHARLASLQEGEVMSKWKPTLVRPWRVVFDESGGYDTLTAAYRIEDGLGALVTKIDVAEYVDIDTWDTNHAENAEARAAAQQIVDAVNDAPCCDAKDDKGFVCTLMPDHYGDHAAHGAYNKPPIKTWPQEVKQ